MTISANSSALRMPCILKSLNLNSFCLMSSAKLRIMFDHRRSWFSWQLACCFVSFVSYSCFYGVFLGRLRILEGSRSNQYFQKEISTCIQLLLCSKEDSECDSVLYIKTTLDSGGACLQLGRRCVMRSSASAWHSVPRVYCMQVSVPSAVALERCRLTPIGTLLFWQSSPLGPQKENQKPAIRGHGPWPMTHPLSFKRDFFELTDSFGATLS